MAKKTLLKMYGDWCVPCKQLDAILKDVIASGKMDNYDFENVDIASSPDVAAHYRVRAVPTMIIIDEEGNELKRHVGVMDKKTLERWLLNNL